MKSKIGFLLGTICVILTAATGFFGNVAYQERGQRFSLEKQNIELDSNIKKMESQIKDLETIRTDLQDKVAFAEEERERLKEDVTGLIEKNASMKEELYAEIRRRKNKADLLIEEINSEKKEKILLAAKLRNAEKALAAAKEECERMKLEKVELEKAQKTFSEEEQVLLDAVIVYPEEKISRIEGRVLVVNREYGFIVTDIGNICIEGNRLKKDDMVYIYSAQNTKEELGRARAERVNRDLSVCVLLTGTGGEKIQEGDLVVKAP